MKTKRILAFLLAFTALLSFSACKGNTEKENNESKVNESQVENTDTEVEIELKEDFSDYTEKELSRWYPEYTDHLIPSEEYGELIPFAGNINYYENVEMDNLTPLYGLCTTDGKIVVDAVYTKIEYYNGYYILQSSMEWVNDEPVYTRWVISTDGSDVFETKDPYGFYFMDDLIYFETKICTLEGEVLFENDESKTYHPFNRERVHLRKTKSENPYYSTSYLITYSGEELAGPFDYLYHLTDDFYAFEDIETGLKGIIDDDGKTIVEAEYNKIEVSEEFIMFVKGTKVIIKDKNLNNVSEFDVFVGEKVKESEAWRYIYLTGALIEVHEQNETNEYPYKYYDKNGEEKNGVECDNTPNGSGYYITRENNTLIICDRGFNEKLRIDGEYSFYDVDESENRLILNSPNGYKIYDVKLGKFIDTDIDQVIQNFYYKTDENSEKTAYYFPTGQKIGKVNGKLGLYAEFFASVWELETSKGTSFIYEYRDDVYTINQDLQTIFKNKVEND